jgi:hypothetical protein
MASRKYVPASRSGGYSNQYCPPTLSSTRETQEEGWLVAASSGLKLDVETLLVKVVLHVVNIGVDCAVLVQWYIPETKYFRERNRYAQQYKHN